MKKTKILIFTIIITLAVFLLLSGCNILPSKGEDSVAVSSIQLDDTTIYLAPTGGFSVFQLEPKVMPQDASDKRVYYQIVDASDAAYLTISKDGKLMAMGQEKEDSIRVRIISQSNPKVFLNVFVNVVKDEVKRVSFDTSVLKLELDGQPKKISAKITPHWAEEGAELGYEILSSDPNAPIAKVDSDGYVTPLSRGKTTVRVYTKVGYGYDSVEGFLSIDVSYAPLNYHIKVRDDNQSIFKQINGSFESFYVELFKLDTDKSDPSPEIRWYLDDSLIQDSGVQGNKNVKIDLPRITLGVHTIKAVLSSGEDTQTLTLPSIWVYQPLTAFNVLIRNPKASYEVGDTVEIIANHGEGQYPPDSYAWYLKDNSRPHILPKLISQLENNTLYYEIKETGDFTIICQAVVKGMQVVSHSVNLTNIETPAEGNDIYGVYIDGGFYEDSYVPHIRWDALPYDARLEVQIRDLSSENEYTLSNEDSEQARYFTRNGVYIPPTMMTLEDSFEVKIKSTRYGFTDWYSYYGDITPEYYEFLKPLVLDMNSYIVNMQELGALLNYISVFRPAKIAHPEKEDTFVIDIYIPFDYDSVKEGHPHNNTSNSDKIAEQNAFNLIDAAFNSYADTGSFSISYRVEEQGNLTIDLTFPMIIDEYQNTPPSSTTQIPFEPHYASTPRGVGAILPIDNNTNTIEVSTSNQLYYGASLGYRPLPVVGSGAELIYNEARGVLQRIINDGMSDAEKVHAIYDYLTTEVTYDYNLLYMPEQDKAHLYAGIYLEGVFLHGRAVCDGIAKAFNLLAWMEGISSKKISGTAIDSGIGHAWNKVLVGGEWYIVDATWGSMLTQGNRELQTHNYLLTTDNAIKDTHLTNGVYEGSSETRHSISTNYSITQGISSYIDSEDALIAVFDYISAELDSKGFIWLEVYFSSAFKASNSVLQSYLSGYQNIQNYNIIRPGDEFVIFGITG